MMDAIKAIKGVGSVQEFGSDYAMRIWLDPDGLPNLAKRTLRPLLLSLSWF